MSKKITLLFIFSLIWGVFVFAAPQGSSSETEKIELKEAPKKTRPATAILVTASVNESIVNVSIENYTGEALVTITGNGENCRQFYQIIEEGTCIYDISLLKSGNYTIQITLENTIYKGIFEK